MSHFQSSFTFSSLVFAAVCAYADDSEQAVLQAQNSVGDRLEVVELRPSLDSDLAKNEFHLLKEGQRMSVQFQYTIESVEGAKISVVPFADKKRLRKYQTHWSRTYPKGSATGSCYFISTDESVADEIQIRCGQMESKSWC